MITDLENDSLTIYPVLGLTNPGSWFSTNDSTCSPVLSLVSPGADGSYAIQLTGSGCATFSTLGFYFADDTTVNGTYVDAEDNNTGVAFKIKESSGNVTSVRFEYLDDYSTNGIPGNSCGTACGPGYGQDLTISTTWTPVTIFWDTCSLPTWYLTTTPAGHPRDPWNMYGMHWIVNANGNNFGVEIDDVQFIHNVPPPTPTPDCSKIDDMEDNDNRGIIYSAGNCGSNGTTGLHTGYWYTYQDSLGGVMWPAANAVFAMSSPGAYGTSNYAARITGICSSSGSVYAGVGLNMVDPKNFWDMTVSGRYSGIKFDAMVGSSSPTTVRFKIPDIDTDPDGAICPNYSTCSSANASSANGCCYDDYGMDMVYTTSWTNYQLNFTALTQVGFGYTPPAGFNPKSVSAIQWQFGETSSNFDLWIDNITLY
jgi:hypothetical protein